LIIENYFFASNPLRVSPKFQKAEFGGDGVSPPFLFFENREIQRGSNLGCNSMTRSVVTREKISIFLS
jgi:hypothetical protein